MHLSLFRRAFLIFSLALFSFPGFSQESESNGTSTWKIERNRNTVYTYRIEPIYVTPTAKITEAFKYVSQSGFRIKTMDEEVLLLEVRNINGIKDFLKKNSSILKVGEKSITAAEIKEQLYPQFKGKFYDGDLNKFKKYLKKTKQRGYLRNTTWALTLPGSANKSFSVDLYIGKSPYASIVFTPHTTYLADDLRELENAECDPIERQLFFGWENYDRYLEDMKYRKYRPRSIVYEDKSFKLYFDYNSSEYNPNEVDAITQYALDSNLIISRAKIEAYASVEGNAENNMRLQQERAEVLIGTFEKVNNEDIEADIITSENWGMFREQLATNGWHEFDSLSEDEIKEVLESDSAREKYEPLLKEQRFANLEIRFGKVLGMEDKEEKMIQDFERYHKAYIPPTMNKQTVKNDRPYRRNLRSRYYMKKMLAIKEYGRLMVKSGRFSEDVFDVLYRNSLPEMNLLDFFEITRLLKKGEDLSHVPVDSVILRAYKDAAELKDPSEINIGDRNFKHSIQILTTVMELVNEQRLDAEILSYFKYPDLPGYSHLNNIRDKFIFENDIEIKNNVLDMKGSKEWYEHPWTKAYYSKIKELSGVTIKNGSLRINERNDFFYQFDLWEFIWFNVDYWEPEAEKYYDPEINPDRMGVLIRKLVDVNDEICSDKLYDLALMYHIKMLRYKNHIQKFDSEANYSYNFIKDYYFERIPDTDPELAEKVYQTLFTFNNYFFYNNAQKDVNRYKQRLPKQWKRFADNSVENSEGR